MGVQSVLNPVLHHLAACYIVNIVGIGVVEFREEKARLAAGDRE
jgi:hypothetical protein